MGGQFGKRRLLYKLSIFWGSMLVFGSVVAGFLPPNFSKKKIYCAVVKVDRFPPKHSGYSSFNHHHHVYCLSSSLYFTYISFGDRFVDPSMAF